MVRSQLSFGRFEQKVCVPNRNELVQGKQQQTECSSKSQVQEEGPEPTVESQLTH